MSKALIIPKSRGKQPPPRLRLEVYDIYNQKENIVLGKKNLKMALDCFITLLSVDANKIIWPEKST